MSQSFVSKVVIAGAVTSIAAWASGPKNVILMICDGCGYNHYAAASLFRTGDSQQLGFQQFPEQGFLSTYSASGLLYNPGMVIQDFTWVALGATDSGASATAFGSGIKIPNYGIGIAADSTAVYNVTQAAQRTGRAAGVVTSVPLSHATPAGFVAHVENRYDYIGIAEEMLTRSGLEVVMGGGHPNFDENGVAVSVPDYTWVASDSLWTRLVSGRLSSLDGPWSFIENKGTFDSLAAGLLPMPSRLVGVPKIHTTLQYYRTTVGADSAYADPFIPEVPELSTMSQVALRLLSRDRDGFFLMVEGGATDWASHDNREGRMIEEVLAFSDAVDSVVDWVETFSNWDSTLVIVTSDHETGYLTGPGKYHTDGAMLVTDTIIGNGAGNMPSMVWSRGGHTNQLVPFYAKGKKADTLILASNGVDSIRGTYTDNALIGKMLLDWMGGRDPSLSGLPRPMEPGMLRWVGNETVEFYVPEGKRGSLHIIGIDGRLGKPLWSGIGSGEVAQVRATKGIGMQLAVLRIAGQQPQVANRFIP